MNFISQSIIFVAYLVFFMYISTYYGVRFALCKTVYKYTIDIRPKAKQSTRFTSAKNHQCYTDHKILKWTKEFRAKLINNLHKRWKPLKQKVSIKYEFIFKNAKQKTWGEYKDTSPDVDNLCKAANDAIKGILIDDDKYIVSQQAVKLYAKEDCIRIELELL